ncbi:MAG: polysaccharide deacetylase family protein [Candidatus Sumerlaeota bacterium]|nr:polysaccharide deacetylase family protein [Candidatus Sumerlaeota bacterium]
MIRRFTLLAALVLSSLLSLNARAGADAQTTIARWEDNKACALTITFDDNNANRKQASDILSEFKIRGTFNMITGDMGGTKKDLFKEIMAKGHEIGSHTATHPNLTKVEDEKNLEKEIVGSKQYIEQFTGVPCVSFTYPHGEPGRPGPQADKVRGLVRKNYLSARMMLWGVNGIEGADPIVLRINELPGTEPFTGEARLKALRGYVKKVAAKGGWGVEMYHNLSDTLGDKETMMSLAPETLRKHCEELVSGKLADIWIAPQGDVARYLLERDKAKIKTDATDAAISVTLEMDGDSKLLNYPLTLMTAIPDKWAGRGVKVTRDGNELPAKIEKRDSKTMVVYHATPGKTVIKISPR